MVLTWQGQQTKHILRGGRRKKEQWPCKTCTFLNPAHLLRCELCDVPRSGPVLSRTTQGAAFTTASFPTLLPIDRAIETAAAPTAPANPTTNAASNLYTTTIAASAPAAPASRKSTVAFSSHPNALSAAAVSDVNVEDADAPACPGAPVNSHAVHELQSADAWCRHEAGNSSVLHHSSPEAANPQSTIFQPSDAQPINAQPSNAQPFNSHSAGSATLCRECGVSVPLHQEQVHHDWHYAARLQLESQRDSRADPVASPLQTCHGGDTVQHTPSHAFDSGMPYSGRDVESAFEAADLCRPPTDALPAGTATSAQSVPKRMARPHGGGSKRRHGNQGGKGGSTIEALLSRHKRKQADASLRTNPDISKQASIQPG